MVMKHTLKHLILFFCIWNIANTSSTAGLPLLNNATINQSVFAGGFLTLQCNISFATQIRWETNNSDINETIITKDLGNNVSISELLVSSSKDTEYLCIGINLNGNVSHKIYVKVIALPDPLTIILKDKTSNSITIGWEEHPLNLSNKFYSITYKQTNSLNISHSINVSFNVTSYEISSLIPYTNYTVTVRESFEDGVHGQESSITVETDQSAPDAPESLKLKGRTAKSIIVEWKKPKFLNGFITKVLVAYGFNVSNTTNTTEIELNELSKFEIVGLLPYVLYEISVRYKTIVYGKASTIFARTLEEGPQISPSDFSAYNQTSSSVIFSWKGIPCHLRGGELKGYQLNFIPNEPSVFVNDSSTSVIERLVINLKPYTNYSVTLKAMNKGDKEDPGKEDPDKEDPDKEDPDKEDPDKEVPDKEGPPVNLWFSTLQGVPSSPTNLIIDSDVIINETEIIPLVNVRWDPPTSINGKLTDYKIVFWKISRCTEKKCKREMRFYKKYFETNTISNVTPKRSHQINRTLDSYSEYQIQVQEKTEGGWGELSNEFKMVTKPGKASAPVDVTMVSSSYNSITLKWFPPVSANGQIFFYHVYLYSGDEVFIKEDKHYVFNTTDTLSLVVTQLQSETNYIVKIAANNEYTGFLSSINVSTKKIPAILDKPWMFVLIAFLAVVLLVALIMTIMLVSRRQRKYKNVRTDDIEVDAYTHTKPIEKAYLKEYCIQQHANSDHGFQQEYELLKSYPHNFTWEHSQMPYNQPKNRYSNIVAYDHSRVILSALNNDITTTYINASYIDGYKKPKAYIATQGPLPETVIDFWRMIWETKCAIIVMLTNLVEDSRVKCEQYWPEGKGLQYKDIIVTVDSVREMTDYTVRMFTLQKFKCPELGSRQVRQYHYTTWPDHGVPSHPTSVLSFTRHVMSYMDTLPNAECVVHCSAGVGRTGTFIAIEMCLRQLESENKVDVFGSVFSMRTQRNFMVQTELQYTFIYDALLDSVVCGNTEIAPADLPAKIRFLNEQDPETNASNFASEFKRLESGISPGETNQFIDAAHHDNKQKNRYLNILPYDKNRVRLLPIAGSRQSDYVNASVIDGFQQKNAFIAAQAPLENTVKDFWRMILEKKIYVIVMLTKLEEKGQEKCYLYWPQAGAISYGSIHVELLNVRKDDDNLLTHELRITNQETGRSWIITHFWFLGWPDYGSPESGSELIQLIGLVQKSKKSNPESGPILVHCSGGVGRTGVFMAVLNSIERLKVKGVVDIFQTTRALRLQRTAMVQTVDQYMFCYQALRDYLDSFDFIAVAKC